MGNNLVEQNEKANKNDGLKIIHFILNIIGLGVIVFYISVNFIEGLLYIHTGKSGIINLMVTPLFVSLICYSIISLIISLANIKKKYKVNLILSSIIVILMMIYSCEALWYVGCFVGQIE